MPVLSLCLAAAFHIAAPAEAIPPARYRVDVLAKGLDHPWNIAFLPDGAALVTERPGRLSLLVDGKINGPVTGVPAVFARGQAGLFEAEPHPDFATNGLIYLTYAAEVPGGNTLVLARGKLVRDAAGARLDGVAELFRADAVRKTSAHYGGRLVWRDDGTLLLTSGDGYAHRAKAQKLDNHFGKILRLTADGKAAPGNPYLGRADASPEVWSYGHRNPQGIAEGADGAVYANEHGPRGGDELNKIAAGANFGWPIATYGIDYSGAQISPFKTLDGVTNPLAQWTPSIAPSSLTFVDGPMFTSWRGHALIGALAFTHLRMVDMTAPAERQWELLGERKQRVRDVAMAPDGAIWVATESREGAGGEILRVTLAR